MKRNRAFLVVKAIVLIVILVFSRGCVSCLTVSIPLVIDRMSRMLFPTNKRFRSLGAVCVFTWYSTLYFIFDFPPIIRVAMGDDATSFIDYVLKAPRSHDFIFFGLIVVSWVFFLVYLSRR